MKVVLVEKEKLEAAKLYRVLKLVDPSISITKTFQSLQSLLEWTHSHPAPDIFLINQKKLPGLTVDHTTVLARLVLHTKQESLTYLAFRSTAMELLKNFPGIPAPVQKGIEVEKKEDPVPQMFSFKHRFFVESGKRFLSIPANDIAYFFSDGRFVYFITHTKQKYLIHYRMDELEQLLDPLNFYRINRSYIASINSIDRVLPYFGSRFKLKLQPSTEEEILVSRNRAPGFRKWMGE